MTRKGCQTNLKQSRKTDDYAKIYFFNNYNNIKVIQRYNITAVQDGYYI